MLISGMEILELRQWPKQAVSALDVGCLGLEVGCQPFFLVRCRSGCWLPALLEVSSQQLHCLSVESQNNDPGGLFHVLKS